MVIKKLNNSDPGTADAAGGNDWDQISDLLNFGFTSSEALKLKNAAGFSGSFVAPALTVDSNIQPFQRIERNIVYKDGNDNKYYAMQGSTGRIQAGPYTDPDDAISFVFDNGTVAEVYIKDGTYPLSSSFAGFNLRSQCLVHLNRGTILQVPQGYTGYVFKFDSANGAGSSIVEGGKIEEAGTPTKLWKGIVLDSTTTGGCSFNIFRDMIIKYAGVGIHLKVSTNNGFVNGNSFRNIIIDAPIKYIQFENTGGGPYSLNGNNFTNIMGQSTAATTNGIQDIMGQFNVFNDVKMWDFTGSAISANITANAINTVIIGGIVTFLNFVDLGEGTTIMDEWKGTRMPNVVYHPGIKKMGSFYGTSAGNACSGLLEASMSANNSGTGAANAFRKDSTGTREEWTTGTTQNSICGLRVNAALVCERDLNPMVQFKIAMQATTAERMTMGFTSTSAAIGTAGADPLANLSGVVFFYDSTVDGNWHICQNDGSASSDNTTIANVVAADVNPHVFGLRANNALAKFQYYYGTGPPTPGSTWTNINTKIPAAATAMGCMFYMENTTTAAKTFQVWWQYLEIDA